MWWLSVVFASGPSSDGARLPALPVPIAPTPDGRIRVVARGAPERFEGLRRVLDHAGRPLGRLGWVPMEVSPAELATLRASGVRVELDRPLRRGPPPTRVTSAQVGATAVRHTPGGPTGLGVRVANIDTDIDVLHPHFFRADAGISAWFDADSDGVLTPGVDGLDRDGDGSVGTDEVLWRLQGWTWRYDTSDEEYVFDEHVGLDPASDWLFLDLDGDGERGVGRPGWTDEDPGMGEPTFVPDDVDGDGRITSDERLWQLGTSVVEAVWRDGEVFRRGEDLTRYARQLTDDTSHGTSVSGIIVGGQLPGQRLFSGLAPDADLIFVSYLGSDTLAETVAYLEFVEEAGVDVLLHEYAPWTGTAMDGSSALEELVDTLAADGMAQVCAAGNLADAGKHTRVSTVGDLGTAAFTLGFDTTYLELEVHPDPPVPVQDCTLSGPFGEVPYDIGYQQGGGVEIWAEGETSELGNTRLYAVIYGDVPQGAYTLSCQANGADAMDVYVADEAGWDRGAVFEDEVRTGTMGVPATAEHCLAVAASAGRWADDGADVGGLRSWSSRGPALGGQKSLDLAAPDDPYAPGVRYDGTYGGSYTAFGGTSGAAPHVAAVAALVKQVHPDWTGIEVRAHLRATADPAVPGPDPDGWGMGRVDAWAALHDGPRPDVPPPVEVRVESFLLGEPTQVVAVGDEVRWDLGYDGTIDHVGPQQVVRAGEIARVEVFGQGARLGGAVVRGLDAPEPRACGCATGAVPTGGLVWVALLLALVACKRSPTPVDTSEADADTDADTDTDADADTDADSDTDTDSDTDPPPLCDEDAREPNDALAQALPIVEEAGLWVQQGAPDFWSFVIQPGQEVEVTVTHDALAGDVDVYVLNANGLVTGQPGATFSPVETAIACNPTAAPQTWTAYVEVWSASLDPCNTYALAVEFGPSTGCVVDTGPGDSGDTSGGTGDTGLSSPTGDTGATETGAAGGTGETGAP